MITATQAKALRYFARETDTAPRADVTQRLIAAGYLAPIPAFSTAGRAQLTDAGRAALATR